jgi:hypothetical protein
MPIHTKVTINKPKLEGVLAGRVGAWTRLILADISAAAAVRTPVDTGRLRSGRLENIKFRRNKVTGYVYYRVHYAGYVHDGRGEVRPVRAKALRFVIGGRTIFATKVGPARAQPWLRDAMVAVARKRRGLRIVYVS